ncbi:YchJ family protein [Actinokineospora sp. NPDC004072]
MPAKCPCGRPVPLARCCGRVHAGLRAPTAEALMRSRYTAFAVGDRDHLLRTWHPSTRPAELTLDPRQRWERLEILSTTDGGLLHHEGTVEFRAHYRLPGGVRDSLHETSRFVRDNGQWLYVDGLIR